MSYKLIKNPFEDIQSLGRTGQLSVNNLSPEKYCFAALPNFYRGLFLFFYG